MSSTMRGRVYAANLLTGLVVIQPQEQNNSRLEVTVPASVKVDIGDELAWPASASDGPLWFNNLTKGQNFAAQFV